MTGIVFYSLKSFIMSVNVTVLFLCLSYLTREANTIVFSALTLLVGWQEGHPACKKWDGGGGHWMVRMVWRPDGWSVCLPLLIFPCTIKSRSSLLAPAHPGGPGKRAVKWLWWWHAIITENQQPANLSFYCWTDVYTNRDTQYKKLTFLEKFSVSNKKMPDQSQLVD